MGSSGEAAGRSPDIAVVSDLEAIRARPRRPLEGASGVSHTVLWSEGGDRAGAMWVEAGSTVPEHAHEEATHHAWLLEGAAEVDGRRLGPGGYWHVPAGVPHDVVGLPPDGCLLVYLYLRGP